MNITKEQVEALINCLRNGEQCDADGMMTKISRQAAYEAADALSALAARGGEPVAWMSEAGETITAATRQIWLDADPNGRAASHYPIPLYTHPKAEVQPGWKLAAEKAVFAYFHNRVGENIFNAMTALKEALAAAPQGDTNG